MELMKHAGKEKDIGHKLIHIYLVRVLGDLRSKDAPVTAPPTIGEIFGPSPAQLLESDLVDEVESTPEITEVQDVIDMTVDHTETTYNSEG